MTVSIVVLLADPADADAVIDRLSSHLRRESEGGVGVERPPDELLGANFMTRPAEAQAWWEGAAAATASEWLMVTDDAPSLLDEIDGVASRWLVWCRHPSRAAAYAGAPNAYAVVADDASVFADLALRWLARDERFARLLRPTFGPFRRAVPPEGRIEPATQRPLAVDGEAELIGATTDEAARDVITTTPLVIGAPPVEFLAPIADRPGVAPAPSDHEAVDAGDVSADAPLVGGRWPRGVAATGIARHGDAHPDGPPRAAVPPPPPVLALTPAAVPAPPAPMGAAIPAPPAPPEWSQVDRPPPIAVGAALPPVPPEVDRLAESARTRAAELVGGRTDPRVADGPAALDDESRSLLSGRADITVGGADGAVIAAEPPDLSDVVASPSAPLDALPVLEPPNMVAAAGERAPRQVGFWALPSAWGRRRRGAAAHKPAADEVKSPRTDASQAHLRDERSLDEMTEPQLRGEAARLLMLGPPLVVVCCSRKGGVGKTYDILGIAELADEAGEAFAVRSVLLEQNLENPDLRIVLGLPEATATVRQLDRMLSDGMDAPGAAHPTQSNLSVYVEERETSAYPRESIDRLARHCRGRYGLTAVDLANCLPDVAGGKAAAAVAYWLRQADVVMMPTDASRSGLRGMAEMIDAVRAQGSGSAERDPGIVIPFLVQPSGKALQYPGIREILARYDGLGAKPVAVPFSEETQLAGWEDAAGQRTTILHDDAVRLAYWRLLVAVLRAGNARGGG